MGAFFNKTFVPPAMTLFWQIAEPLSSLSMTEISAVSVQKPLVLPTLDVFSPSLAQDSGSWASEQE
jgi:hypothetical protein